ncbi:MAG TPA: hypothetical protein VE109_04610, partial [Acidobacteriaceae bacterium]|nr:hypothetical protein [Acidobacteriaceae bacterium]
MSHRLLFLHAFLNTLQQRPKAGPGRYDARTSKRYPDINYRVSEHVFIKAENTESMKTRPWLQGGGVAMLYLFPPLAEFLSPARRNFYHQLLPVTTLTRGLLIDVLVLGLLGGIAFTLLDCAAPRLK